MGNLANLLGCGSSSLITPDTKRNSTVKAGWSIGKKGCSSRSSPMQQRNMLSWAIHNLMAAAGVGIKHKQPYVTVGAVRELDALLGLVLKTNSPTFLLLQAFVG